MGAGGIAAFVVIIVAIITVTSPQPAGAILSGIVIVLGVLWIIMSQLNEERGPRYYSPIRPPELNGKVRLEGQGHYGTNEFVPVRSPELNGKVQPARPPPLTYQIGAAVMKLLGEEEDYDY